VAGVVTPFANTQEVESIERITPRVLREQSRVSADDRLQRCTTASDRCGRAAFDDLDAMSRAALVKTEAHRHGDAGTRCERLQPIGKVTGRPKNELVRKAAFSARSASATTIPPPARRSCARR